MVPCDKAETLRIKTKLGKCHFQKIDSSMRIISLG